MGKSTQATRRDFLAGVSSAALFATGGYAQSATTFEDFAARARVLSGFDPVPRALLSGLRAVLSDRQEVGFLSGQGASSDIDKTLLRALYTGIYQPDTGSPTRISYAQALMYAAIEDAVNVPSYCGGLPGYWSEKPSVS